MISAPHAGGVFVTGTDTGAGKTRVAVALLRACAAGGVAAVGMKPVAAGIEPGQTVNDDVLALDAAGAVRAPLADRNPYAFSEPIAPHVAAAREGRRIDLAAIADAYRRLAAVAGFVGVEGAGGPLVPLSQGTDMLDIARVLRLPVILVVGLRLGCLSQALACELAIRARGLVLAGWVANRVDPSMACADESVAAIAERLPAPMLADLAFGSQGPISERTVALLRREA